MPKLVAIGDSLTQGVQSGAIFKTELSYPALIAESMGLNVPNDFRVPRFPGSGLPLNIEWLLRSMRRELGNEISSREWISEVPYLLADRFDYIEDLYERGAGSRPASYGGVYHNLAVSGFRVSDSFEVHSQYCCNQIKKEEGWFNDDFFGLPSAPMYRIAQRVLNPKQLSDRKCWTQIDNLKYLNKQEGGVENLILFLGANDCLGTVRDLKIKDMKCEKGKVSDDPEQRRANYNLTSPKVFKKDYRKMVQQISQAISKDTKVFVGTVPHVTIPPITQAISGKGDFKCNGKTYFEYYYPFFVNEDNFSPKDRHLTGKDVKKIDKRIDAFNCVIKKVIKKQNKRNNNSNNWHIVDICQLLDDLACKRKKIKIPRNPLQQFFAAKGCPNHPLLDDNLKPTPNVLRFETCDNQRTNGGLFSLDCFHPTTIGYGLIAEEFLRVMKKANVPDAKPKQLNWQRIIKQDTLIQSPPVLWDDIIAAAEAHPRLSKSIYNFLT